MYLWGIRSIEGTWSCGRCSELWLSFKPRTKYKFVVQTLKDVQIWHEENKLEKKEYNGNGNCWSLNEWRRRVLSELSLNALQQKQAESQQFKCTPLFEGLKQMPRMCFLHSQVSASRWSGVKTLKLLYLFMCVAGQHLADVRRLFCCWGWMEEVLPDCMCGRRRKTRGWREEVQG